MIKISVIVPVFNVEKYLKRCVDSLVLQTFSELEIILVDDGAQDSSGQLCDLYALEDQRIKVIHKKNGGLSSARNAGLSIAQGEYIAFIDSDDYIQIDMMEKMYKKAQEEMADLIVCAYTCYRQEDGELISEKDNVQLECVVDSGTALKYLVENRYNGMVMAWNKLYHRKLFKNIRYPEGKLHEDEYIIHRLLYLSNKIVFMPDTFYNYMIGNSSITTVKYNVRRLDGIGALLDRHAFFKEKHLKEYELKIVGHIFQSIVVSLEKSKYKREFQIVYKKISKELRERNIQILQNKYLSYRFKIWGSCFLVSPRLSYFVLKILHIKRRN